MQAVVELSTGTRICQKVGKKLVRPERLSGTGIWKSLQNPPKTEQKPSFLELPGEAKIRTFRAPGGRGGPGTRPAPGPGDSGFRSGSGFRGFGQNRQNRGFWGSETAGLSYIWRVFSDTPKNGIWSESVGGPGGLGGLRCPELENY